jgi:hypothetical protein
MTTMQATASPSPTRPTTSAAIAAIVLVAFGTFSVWVAAGHGLVGFVGLVGREPWALQMLLDLAIACWIAIGWVIGDARKRGIAAWPFIAATVLAGSIGLLAYLVRRAWR